MAEVIDEEYFIKNFGRLRSLVDYVLEGLGDGSLDEASIDDLGKIKQIRILGVGIFESEEAELLDRSLQTYLKNHGGLKNFVTKPMYELSPLISAVLVAYHVWGRNREDFSNMGTCEAWRILMQSGVYSFQTIKPPADMTDIRVHFFRKFCGTSNNEVVRMIKGNVDTAIIFYIQRRLNLITHSMNKHLEAAVKRHKVRQIPEESSSPKLIAQRLPKEYDLQLESEQLQATIISKDAKLSYHDDREVQVQIGQQENIETAVARSSTDNSIVEKKDAYFWDILEEENNVKVPEYVKNILSFENLDNPRTFKNINDDTLTELKEFLRGDMQKFLKEDFNFKLFYGRYHWKPSEFRFSAGDRYLIYDLQKFVTSKPDDFWNNYNLKPFPLDIDSV